MTEYYRKLGRVRRSSSCRRVAAQLALVGVLVLLPPLWRHGSRLVAGRRSRGGE